VTTAAKPVYAVQVRELVEFSLRRGDLGGASDFVGPQRALAGTRGHQRLQRSRPADYQKEVRVCHEIETADFLLRIQGRLDGLLATATGVLLEEIKTVQGRWDGVADPLHWAQAKCYGFIYTHEHGLDRITLQLTYLDLETGKVSEFGQEYSAADLAGFFQEATAPYLEWMQEQYRWGRHRDQSIRSLDFPFSRYRPGQRELAVAAYRTLAKGGRLFVEAPTGIGKTISILFPAIKAVGEGKLDRIFYLTARTVGRAAAEKALRDLRQAGLCFRTLSLTAKDKICARIGAPGALTPNPPPVQRAGETGPAGEGGSSDAGGPSCDPGACPFACGYYDRIRPALRAALSREEITRPVLEAVGREHQVCPFELSLDLSSWVDAVVCDYNYVFDPRVYLRRHFAEEGGPYAFLVDEAHNLVDRAREMFSAELGTAEIHEVRRAIKESLPRCAKALSKLAGAMRKLGGHASEDVESAPAEELVLELGLFRPETEPVAAAVASRPSEPFARRNENRGIRVIRELPAPLGLLTDGALKEAEAWLARNQPADFRQSLLELYFRLHSFRRTAELYDERYVIIVEPGIHVRVRLFCLDPSRLLRQALARGQAAVCFSATLTPLEYYRALLGGSPEDPQVQLPSPFPPENLAVLVHDRIRTHLKARAETLADVVQVIEAVTQSRPGNYLVFLPSYQYLVSVQEQFAALHPGVSILGQRPGMTEVRREEFLGAFAAERTEGLLGFAVMGGIFGESIDLVGDRLIGVIVVGVGLPQLGVERDLMRDYFEQTTGAGFDYAYTFPGMNRVLQATGRVIRSETDRGLVVLIDTRFAEPRYRRLFPGWWRPVGVRSISELREALDRFWLVPHG
jgi:DNA excision repair protein ERCC-2